MSVGNDGGECGSINVSANQLHARVGVNLLGAIADDASADHQQTRSHGCKPHLLDDPMSEDPRGVVVTSGGLAKDFPQSSAIGLRNDGFAITPQKIMKIKDAFLKINQDGLPVHQGKAIMVGAARC